MHFEPLEDLHKNEHLNHVVFACFVVKSAKTLQIMLSKKAVRKAEWEFYFPNIRLSYYWVLILVIFF